MTKVGRFPPLRVTPAWIQRQTRTDALREATTLVVCCVQGRRGGTAGTVTVFEPETLRSHIVVKSVCEQRIAPKFSVLTQQLR